MIKYKSGYKYQLAEDYQIHTGISPQSVSFDSFLEIHENGFLNIRKGYCWDGPSGPTIDTKTFMRGSLVHDALYQLIRQRVIHRAQRVTADALLKKICLEDGMSKLRAWWVYKGVRVGGRSATEGRRPLITAP